MRLFYELQHKSGFYMSPFVVNRFNLITNETKWEEEVNDKTHNKFTLECKIITENCLNSRLSKSLFVISKMDGIINNKCYYLLFILWLKQMFFLIFFKYIYIEVAAA